MGTVRESSREARVNIISCADLCDGLMVEVEGVYHRVKHLIPGSKEEPLPCIHATR